MLSTGRILVLQTISHCQRMGIAWQKLKVKGTSQGQEGGTKAAFFCRGLSAAQLEGAARGREGALGTWDRAVGSRERIFAGHSQACSETGCGYPIDFAPRVVNPCFPLLLAAEFP